MLRMLILGGLGYLGYKKYQESQQDGNGVAFAKGEPDGPFRNAGADATRSHDKMDKLDEELDETYPASDPPANY